MENVHYGNLQINKVHFDSILDPVFLVLCVLYICTMHVFYLVNLNLVTSSHKHHIPRKIITEMIHNCCFVHLSNYTDLI